MACPVSCAAIPSAPPMACCKRCWKGKAVLLGRIVMVAQEIVRLDNLDIVDLRRLQNLARAFRARDVRACAHLRPISGRRGSHESAPRCPMIKGTPIIKQPVTYRRIRLDRTFLFVSLLLLIRRRRCQLPFIRRESCHLERAAPGRHRHLRDSSVSDRRTARSE